VRSRRSSGARRSVAWRNALVGPRLSASIRPPRSLPSSAALGRLAIDLAAALLSAIATTLAFDGNGWIAWAALAPLLIVCGRTSAARAFAIGLAFGALTTLGVERPVPFDAASGVAHALSLLAHASLYPAIACATLPLLVRSRLPLAITVPALWVLLDQLAAGTGAAVLPSIGLAATQHDNLSMAALSVLSGEAGVTALIVGVNVAVARLLAEPLRGWPTALGMSMIVAGVQVGVVVPIAWQAPSPSAGVAVLAIVAIPAIVLALAALARAESGDRR
jgi:apolipoprotein N-acyltransferase